MKKANNYLNIKEKKLGFYFQIALMVSQRSLQTEFAKMFFSSLLQAKGVFLRSARDLVVNGCGLPYRHFEPLGKLATIGIATEFSGGIMILTADRIFLSFSLNFVFRLNL